MLLLKYCFFVSDVVVAGNARRCARLTQFELKLEQDKAFQQELAVAAEDALRFAQQVPERK
ncbi:MAG: hypothetical protein K0R55_2333 [Sporomusa sp.]|nr:hypothetical protein [Sporomusa sp.]